MTTSSKKGIGFFGKEHTERSRQKIKLHQIIERVNSCALGLVEMKATELRAAEVLLKKAMPDLQSTQLTGADEGPLIVELVQFEQESKDG